MGIEIKSDTIVINTSDRDANGKQIDPEEKPAERQMGADIPVLTTGAGAAGVLPQASITADGTVGQFAMRYKGRCRLCVHFDRKAFLKWKSDVESSGDTERRKVLNALRAQLLSSSDASIADKHQGKDGDLDVEHALKEFGLCRVMQELLKDMVFVWPEAGCPETDPAGIPFKAMFKPRDEDARRESDAGYDGILQAAKSGAPKRKATKINLLDYFAKK
jgi:hypothetical protein